MRDALLNRRPAIVCLRDVAGDGDNPLGLVRLADAARLPVEQDKVGALRKQPFGAGLADPARRPRDQNRPRFHYLFRP